MTVFETDLPGVGKKFEVEIGDEKRLVIVTHNTGKREVFLKAQEGADSERLFELSDRLARTVGTILEGAYFQPVQTNQVEAPASPSGGRGTPESLDELPPYPPGQWRAVAVPQSDEPHEGGR